MARSRFSIGALFEGAASTLEKLGRAPAGMPARIWQETGPWVLNFSANATAKWLPVLLQGIPCTIMRADFVSCTNHAVARCCACKKACCVHHCCSDQHGDVVCYACVVELIRVKTGQDPVVDPARAASSPPPEDARDRQPPVPPDLREERVKRAFVDLKLKPGADWKQIKSAWRKLSKEHHPDRFTNPTDQARHETIYKKVQVAYADLERFYLDGKRKVA